MEKARITDIAEQTVILEEKMKDLYIAYEVEDFVHVEKEISILKENL